LIDFLTLLNAMFFAAPMSRIHKSRTARETARMCRCERAHAAFLFLQWGTISACLIDASYCLPRCWRKDQQRIFGLFCRALAPHIQVICSLQEMSTPYYIVLRESHSSGDRGKNH
jgi:hypothetical protein